jgi:hypothetical protein
MKFQLRDEVIDVLTGFKGMITARAEYLLEDNNYRIQPIFKKYENHESKWIAEGRLELGK